VIDTESRRPPPGRRLTASRSAARVTGTSNARWWRPKRAGSRDQHVAAAAVSTCRSPNVRSLSASSTSLRRARCPARRGELERDRLASVAPDCHSGRSGRRGSWQMATIRRLRPGDEREVRRGPAEDDAAWRTRIRSDRCVTCLNSGHARHVPCAMPVASVAAAARSCSRCRCRQRHAMPVLAPVRVDDLDVDRTVSIRRGMAAIAVSASTEIDDRGPRRETSRAHQDTQANMNPGRTLAS